MLINNDIKRYNDIQSDIEYKSIEIMNYLIKGDMDINEILGMKLGDENVFLLNILENLHRYVDKDKINLIYDNFILYDRLELYSTQNHIWEMKEYSKQIILRSIYLFE